MHTVLNIGRHYIMYSAIRKIEKGKQLVRTFFEILFCLWHEHLFCEFRS